MEPRHKDVRNLVWKGKWNTNSMSHFQNDSCLPTTTFLYFMSLSQLKFQKASKPVVKIHTLVGSKQKHITSDVLKKSSIIFSQTPMYVRINKHSIRCCKIIQICDFVNDVSAKWVHLWCSQHTFVHLMSNIKL